MDNQFQIMSGGQTGADRAALDWAMANGVPCGGWCPRGRKAEDGEIPEGYRLKETGSEDYAQRTEWNVRDSDGTVIFSIRVQLLGGSQLTLDLARKLGKPVLHIVKERCPERPEDVLIEFVKRHSIRKLNIAGSRASEERGISEFVTEVLEKAGKKGLGLR